MSFFQLFKKGYFYVSLLVSVLLLGLLIFFTIRWLDTFTRHDEKMELPNFIGTSLDSLVAYAEKKELRVVVMDSVYDDDGEKGSIVLQNPLPHANVKKGRTLYVTIISQNPELSIMPNLINLSLRQGINLLHYRNLKVQELVYVEGFDKNAIQKVLYEGEEIFFGEKIPKNSKLTLWVSRGTRNQHEVVPDLFGLTLDKATTLLQLNSFNIGRVDNDAEDTTRAKDQFVVYYQYPTPATTLPMGSPINFRLAGKDANMEKLISEAMFLYDSTYYGPPKMDSLIPSPEEDLLYDEETFNIEETFDTAEEMEEF